jgi:hypothetical protein
MGFERWTNSELKAAEDSRTPKRKSGHLHAVFPKVLDCGCPLPLSLRRIALDVHSKPTPPADLKDRAFTSLLRAPPGAPVLLSILRFLATPGIM